MNLETLKAGEEFTIKSLKDNSNPLVARLYAMGLKEGGRAKLLLKNGRVYLIRLDNSRLIIDRETARYIEVA
jgi:ferrous iron transport protein A